MTTLKCPICQRPFEPEQSAAMPFCSERCRMVDLNHWLDESYGIPVDPEADLDPDLETDDDR